MDDEILLGEGVLIDARPASFATRAVGALLDLVVLGIALVALTFVLVRVVGGLDDAAGTAVVLASYVLLLVGVPAAVETLTRGLSLGKLVMGIRVVRDDGGPVRFRHAIVRSLTAVGEVYMTAGGVALLVSLLHPKSKRVGDVLAGTYAVRVRGGQRALPPVVCPPHLAQWARGADIRRLPDGLALSTRQFLGRSGQLHPASRARLGLSLAAELETYVAPGPPPGTHPEAFLAAVLAERRDREFAHASGVAARTRAESALLHRLPHAVPDPRS